MGRIKKYLAIGLILSTILLMVGCSNNEQTKKLNNIKAGLEAKVADIIRTVDVPASSIDDVLHSLEFYYEEPEISGDDISFSGEFSYILGEKKYFQPFTVTGKLSTENFSLSTAGTRVRVENASTEEISKQEDWQNSNSISASKKQAIAEDEACIAAVKKMKDSSWPPYDSWYDLNSTRFDVGKVTEDAGEYKVMGTAYLYDPYGSFKDTLTFTAYVAVDDYGYVSYSRCYLDE